MKALRVVGFALVAALVVACGSGTENEPGEDVVDQDNQADTPAAVCGDGTCNGTETCTTCTQDCGACAPVCGDGTCNGTETCSTCTQDCGACPPGCGDGTCSGTETCSTCPDEDRKSVV